jgi:glycosyltransferase involved in cell wall biosynthesis
VPVERVAIAVVLTAFHPGGTERQMIELIRRLDRARFDVFVACFHREGAWLSKVEEAATEIVELPLRSFGAPSTFAVARRFQAWLRDRRITIVQACDRYSNIFALPAAAFARTPIRIGARRELAPPGQTRGHAALMKLAYRCAHRVVANSGGAARCLAADGVDNTRIVQIPNGIDADDFSSPALGRTPPVIATVANLRPGKGYDVLLRAAARVLTRRPDARFRIIGGGPLREPLLALATQLGIGHAVDFLGHRDDVPSLLADSSLFVFPSLTEAFPNGLLEGMSAGLPIVASDAPGMNELIRHRENGLLVPAGDDPSLADAILALLDAPALAAELGRAARADVTTRYSFERMVASFEGLYERELASRGLIAAPPRASQASNLDVIVRS